ncbi:MAG: hypothetical protein DRJ67_01535 [Thermoprotei archaeon]|nr:MAG: hypothetical protein DRJ67_01535 [Thermoprotei archaeon]
MRREIGTAKEIKEYLIHLEGSPVEMAEAIYDLMKRHGLSQREIAKILGWSQQKVSCVLRLLSLDPELKRAVKEGRLRVTAAYRLASMPPEAQRKFAEKVRRGEKVRVKDVEEEAKRIAIEELRDIIEADLLDTPPVVEEAISVLKRLIEEVEDQEVRELASLLLSKLEAMAG